MHIDHCFTQLLCSNLKVFLSKLELCSSYVHIIIIIIVKVIFWNHYVQCRAYTNCDTGIHLSWLFILVVVTDGLNVTVFASLFHSLLWAKSVDYHAYACDNLRMYSASIQHNAAIFLLHNYSHNMNSIIDSSRKFYVTFKHFRQIRISCTLKCSQTKNKKEFRDMTCHTPLLNKEKKKGKCHYPA